MGYDQFAATSQWFLYGKRHFTQTGYVRHQKDYKDPKCVRPACGQKRVRVSAHACILARAGRFMQNLNLDITNADPRRKNFIITGANSGSSRAVGALVLSHSLIHDATGIGKEIAKFLAQKGAQVIMVCRNAGRAEVWPCV